MAAAPQGIEGVNLIGTRLGAKLKRLFINNESEELYTLNRVFYWSSGNFLLSPGPYFTDRYFVWNLQPAFATNRFSSAQSIWVDNTQNPQDVTITSDQGVSILVPAWGSGMYPIICSTINPSLRLAISNSIPLGVFINSRTRCVIFNNEHEPFEVPPRPRLRQSIGYNDGLGVTGGFVVTYNSNAITTGPSAAAPLYLHRTDGVPVYENLTLNVSFSNGTAGTVNTAFFINVYDSQPDAVITQNPLFVCGTSKYYYLVGNTIAQELITVTAASGVTQLFSFPISGAAWQSSFGGTSLGNKTWPSGLYIQFNGFPINAANTMFAWLSGTVADYRLEH